MNPEDKKTIIQMSHRELQEHWKSIMVEGVLFITLGVIALVLPVAFSIAVEMVVGWLFLIGGGIQLYRSIQSNQAPGFWMMVVSALLAMLLGVLMIFHPLQGLVVITVIIGIYFIAEGIVKSIFALQIQRFASWGWVLLSGVCSIIIGVIVFAGWPSTAMWFVGTLMGVYLIINGVAFMIMANQAHKEALGKE